MFPKNLEKIFQKEHDKGFEQGVERGIETGRLRTLARLLERKFGERAGRMEELMTLSFEQRERLEDLLFEFEEEVALFGAVKSR